MIPDDDRGFLLGDGLFETVLAEQGELVAFQAHVDRLVRSCEEIGLAPPAPRQLQAAALGAIASAGLAAERAAVRISWSAGSGRGLERGAGSPRLSVLAAPAPTREGPLRLVTASIRRNESSPASRLKTLSYLDNVLARREARAAGAEEALMLNTRGEVACAASANLFWIKDGTLHTPSLACGVLAGIVRAEIIAAARETGAPIVETRCGPEALFEADAVFATNSLVGARPVVALDGFRLQEQAEQATVLLTRGRR